MRGTAGTRVAWRGELFGAPGRIASLGRALWSVVTVCSGALQAQVMETPIDAPTCVEGGKPGGLRAGGGGADQLCEFDMRSENGRRGRQEVWPAERKGEA